MMSNLRYTESALVANLKPNFKRVLKTFYVLKGNFKLFSQLLYALSTFQLFINEISNGTLTPKCRKQMNLMAL